LKRVVILTYTFPPSPAIGGRRWAKFAKYLDRNGYDVCVLASDLGKGQNSPWSKDIRPLVNDMKVHYIENGYPQVLDEYPKGILDKIKYRMAIAKVKKDIAGNYYDRSSYWQKKMFVKLEEKLAEGYDTVIATGAPFQYLYYLTRFIKDYPDVKFIADIRDPWANNKTAYGFDSMSEKRKSEVLHFEKEVMSKFHHVVTVYDATTDYFKKRSEGKTKFHTIPNGYDKEDFAKMNFGKKKKGDKIKFVLTGSLYDPALHVFQSFIDGLKELKSSHREIFDQLQFDFYGRENQSYAPYFKDADLQGILKHHGMVDIDEVYENIHAADVCLLFLTDDMNYSKSTKFFEYIAQRRKIAVFSTPGETGKEVEKNRIGYAMTPGNIKDGFLKIHDDFLKGHITIPKKFDPSIYEVQGILKNYIRIIDEKG